MKPSIIMETSGSGGYFADLLDAEFSADLERDGLTVERRLLLENRHADPESVLSLTFVLGVAAETVGGVVSCVLGVYVVRYIDYLVAKFKEGTPSPRIDVTVVYDSRTSRTFRIPDEEEEARRYLADPDSQS